MTSLATSSNCFGVAPVAHDAADLPKRLIAQEITPAAWDNQLAALEGFSFELTRNDLTDKKARPPKGICRWDAAPTLAKAGLELSTEIPNGVFTLAPC